MEEEPKVKLVFANYPLEQTTWAMLGAKYLDCLGRATTKRYGNSSRQSTTTRSEINEQNADQMLKGYVKDAGGNPDAIAACVASPDTEKRVRESMALGQNLDVSSTPTFFINGRRVVGFNNAGTPYDAVKSMVDYELPGK